MTLKEIVNMVAACLAIVVAAVFAIKIGELYKNASQTLEESKEIVDVVYNKLPAIENVLNIVEKLPTVSPSSQK